MMTHDRSWKLIAIGMILAVLTLAAAIGGRAGTPAVSFASPAHAQAIKPAITSDGTDLIVTQDADGRAIHVWGFEKWDQDHLRLPVYLGTVQATDTQR